MRVIQLGNGGGLAPEKTNSSFLVNYFQDELILIDCGFNIMTRLIQGEKDGEFEIKNIKHVYITHTHDDHIGNLETLIYWNFFKNDVQMDIYLPCNLIINKFQDMQKLKNDGKMMPVTLCNIHKIMATNFTLPGNVKFYPVWADHGGMESFGIVLFNETRNIYISGDTVALPYLEETLTKITGSNILGDNSILFHDYSEWDDIDKNVHACKTGFDKCYNNVFQDKLIKYHTGNDNFNKEWIELDIFEI